jgi:hypothetical protein
MNLALTLTLPASASRAAGSGGVPGGFVQIYIGGTATPAGWTAVPDTLHYDGTSVWADPATTVLETTHAGDLDGALDVRELDDLEQLDCDNNAFSSLLVAALASLEVLSCEQCGQVGLSITGCSALLNVNASNNALSEEVVDGILDILDTAGLEDGTVDLSGGTNAVPSAAGLTDKTSLEGKGWTVEVDSPPATEVDMLLRFESGSDTDVLTTVILNAATEGGGGTWSLSASPSVLTISTGAELDVSGVKVSGGSSDDSGGTRGLAIYCGNAQKHANYTLDAAAPAVSCGFAFKIGSGFTGATFSTFDMVRMQGEAGEFVVAQFVDFPGASFGLRVHTSGGNGTIIQLTANTWYWVTMKYVANGTSTLSIYSSADFTTLVGSSTRATVDQDCYLVDIGLESFVDGGASNYIDDFALDLDGSQFPLLPTP